MNVIAWAAQAIPMRSTSPVIGGHCGWCRKDTSLTAAMLAWRHLPAVWGGSPTGEHAMNVVVSIAR
jgi:hypothetical protein